MATSRSPKIAKLEGIRNALVGLAVSNPSTAARVGVAVGFGGSVGCGATADTCPMSGVGVAIVDIIAAGVDVAAGVRLRVRRVGVDVGEAGNGVAVGGDVVAGAAVAGGCVLSGVDVGGRVGVAITEVVVVLLQLPVVSTVRCRVSRVPSRVTTDNVKSVASHGQVVTKPSLLTVSPFSVTLSMFSAIQWTLVHVPAATLVPSAQNWIFGAGVAVAAGTGVTAGTGDGVGVEVAIGAQTSSKVTAGGGSPAPHCHPSMSPSCTI